jgi:apolipoprotein N-acyltransferase
MLGIKRRREWFTPATGARAILKPMLLAALAGALTVFAFAPYGYWLLQPLSLAFLFYQVGLDSNPRRSYALGFGYGFGWAVAGMHWIYISMHQFGGMPTPLAVMGVCLFALYMGLFSGSAMLNATQLRRYWALPVPALFLLVMPASWTLHEWLRGWLFTGYPGGAIGYAHIDAPLAGFAPLIGVYGASLLAAICAGALVMLTQRKRWTALGLVASLMAAGYGLSFINWTTPAGQPISVRLAQGNIDQRMKFDPQHAMATLDQYRDMVRAAPADLIVLPETAIPTFPHNLPADYLPGLRSFAKESGSHIAYGIPLMDTPNYYTNSVAGISPQGAPYRFDKVHLMPFGEYVPRGFGWLVDMMQIPLGDFARGSPVQFPFMVKDQRVLPNICYEDLFGEEIAFQLRESSMPATMLLNVSNLAWYGESLAVHQHLQISRMRALETGRPMLRSTNTGATAITDAKGKITHSLPPYTRGTLVASVQGMQGMTPYIRFGNIPFLLLAGLLLGAAWFFGKKRRQN